LSNRVRKPRAVDPATRARSLYVSGLSWNTTNEQLFDHMNSSSVDCVKATVLRANRRSLGCGVVEYDSHESAIEAVKLLNDTELDGRKIHCREDRDHLNADDGDGELHEEVVIHETTTSSSSKRNTNTKSSEPAAVKVLDECKVFCTNLSWSTTPEDLTLHLSSCGEVLDAEILKRNGKSLGCGFVEFSNPDSVPIAIEQLNGQELQGRVLVIREYYQ